MTGRGVLPLVLFLAAALTVAPAAAGQDSPLPPGIEERVLSSMAATTLAAQGSRLGADKLAL